MTVLPTPTNCCVLRRNGTTTVSTEQQQWHVMAFLVYPQLAFPVRQLAHGKMLAAGVNLLRCDISGNR